MGSTSEPLNANVLILGAGPAGGAAALALARAGVPEVVVIEAKPLPRPKLCSGVISPKTLGLLFWQLRWTGWQDPLTWLGECHTTQMHWSPTTASVIQDHTPYDFVDRASFDARLLRAAQAEMTPPHVVTDRVVAVNPHTGEVQTRSGQSWRARWIIGADGAAGVSSPAVLGQRLPQAVALEAKLPHVDIHLDGETAHLMWDVPGGYGWVFPKRRGVAVGAGSPDPAFFSQLTPYVRELLRAWAPTATWDGPIPGHGIPAALAPRAGLGRTLLVGDAGGWADPLIGEGIPYALWTGYAAGLAVAAADLTRSDALDGYRRAWRTLARWQRPIRQLAAWRSHWEGWAPRLWASPTRAEWIWHAVMARRLPEWPVPRYDRTRTLTMGEKVYG